MRTLDTQRKRAEEDVPRPSKISYIWLPWSSDVSRPFKFSWPSMVMVTAEELSNGRLFEVAPDSVVLWDWIVACFLRLTCCLIGALSDFST